MTLDAQEFIRRFLLHVLPNGFMRIRHFGFLANRTKKQALSRCRELLGLNPALPEIPNQSPRDLMLKLQAWTSPAAPAVSRELWSLWLNSPRSAHGTPHEKLPCPLLL